MFWYLHFTRAPPSHAHLSQPLSITPTIANDLRTEYPITNKAGIEIYHAWVKSVESTETTENESVAALGAMSPPKKLIDWAGSSYKEISVYPPSFVKDGERWHLLLCTRHPETKQFITSINLSTSGSEFGAQILPIISSPILFTSRKSQNADKKQVRNERLLKLPSISGRSIAPLRLVEHISFDLDKKVWDSGLGLSCWLTEVVLRADGHEHECLHRLKASENPVILELGAGTGLVSLLLATLLGNSPETYPNPATIITTDLRACDVMALLAAGIKCLLNESPLASAMEVMNANIDRNLHALERTKPRAIVLDWEEDELPADMRGGVDLIIMADVTYNTDSFPALIRTLSRLRDLCRPQGASVGLERSCSSQAPSESDESSVRVANASSDLESRADRSLPAVLLAYKERHPDERRLWAMANTIGLQLHEVSRVPGASGNPVEIYEGKFVTPANESVVLEEV